MNGPSSLAVLAVFFSAGCVAIAQTLPAQGAAAGITTPALTPGSPDGSYPLSGFEDINYYNGHLNVHLPLMTIGGRGEASYQVTLGISQPTWTLETTPSVTYSDPATNTYTYSFFSSVAPPSEWWNPYAVGYGPGLLLWKQIGSGLLNAVCSGGSTQQEYLYTWSYPVFVSPDGTEHPLYDSLGAVTNSNLANPCAVTYRSGTFASADGSQMTFVMNGSLPDNSLPGAVSNGGILAASGTLYMKNGTEYVIGGCAAGCPGMVSSIQDRNGNMLTFQYALTTVDGSSYTQPYVTQVTDSLGRTISFQYNTTCGGSPECDVITFEGYGGAARAIQVINSPVASDLRADQIALAGAALFPNIDPGYTGASPGTLRDLPRQVVLPNGQTYSFSYNIYGEVARVVLPTGGAIEYDYGAGLSNAGGLSGVYASGQVLDGLTSTVGMSFSSSQAPWQPFIYRRLTSRRVYPTGLAGAGNQAATTTYSLPEAASSPTTYMGLVSGLSITNSGVVSTIQTGTSVTAPLTEQHYFLDSFAVTNGSSTGGIASPGYGPGSEMKLVSAGPPTVPDTWEGKEWQTTIPGVSNTVNVWGEINSPGQVPKVCQTLTTLTDTGQTKQQVLQYDRASSGSLLPAAQQFENPSDTYEYDFGSGPGPNSFNDSNGNAYMTCPTSAAGYTRHTNTGYEGSTAYTAAPVHILDLVDSVTTYDSSGSLAAQTQYGHDGYALLSYGGNVPGYNNSFSATARGNVTSTARYLNTSNSNVTTSRQYDVLGNVTSATDANSNRTTYAYGSAYAYGFLTLLTHPPANGITQSTAIAWDLYLGKPTQIVDQSSGGSNPGPIATTTAAYGNGGSDLLDRLSSVQRGTGSVYQTAPAQTVYAYNDQPGSLELDTCQDLNTYRETSVSGSSCSGGVTTARRFDGFGQPIERRAYESSGYISTQTVYDGLERVYTVTNPFRPGSETAVLTTTSYDGAGRVTQVATQDGSMTTRSYLGNKTQVQVAAANPEGWSTHAYYTDGLGRMTQAVEDPAGFDYSTGYAYTVLDQLTQVNQGGETRNFYYDSLKRLTRAVNVETGPICYGTSQSGNNCVGGYDGNGNLLAKSDARGYTTTMTYDSLNRMATKSYSANAATPNVTYNWDTVEPGKLTSVVTTAAGSSPAVAMSYGSYDALGHPLSSTETVDGYSCGSAGCSFVYSWNLAGSLRTYLLPSGRLVTYAPDAAGRVGTVTGLMGGVTTPYASLTGGTDPANVSVQMPGYASQGAPQRLAMGSGLIERTGFNSRQQPVSIELGVLGNAASVAGLGISYCAGAATADCSNNNGSPQLMTVSPVGVTQSFSYDTLDRLGTASEMPTAGGAAVWSQAYGYDRYGNRWVTSTGLGSNGLEPASQSWYTAATNQFADTTNYDAAGNRTWMSPYTLAYDAENRLASATSPSNGSTTYAYDGDGNRVLALFSNGTYTLYVNDAQGELGAEYSTAAPGGSGTQYVSVDQLGSTRVTTDGSGNVTGRYDYLPFGLELGPLGLANRTAALGYGTAGPRLKFTGKAFDSETGLDYFGARYFSSTQGRFTSPDWSAVPQPVPYADLTSPQSLNLYNYVWNNPLVKADADGHCGLIGGDAPCSFSQFVSSLPDRLVGGLKGESNVILGTHFQASNAEQAEVMGNVNEAAPVLTVGVAMAIPGPKGLEGEAGAIEAETAVGRFSGRYADGEKAYRTNVPRDPVTNEPMPLPEASGPHSRLQPDAKNPQRTYSATEFDAKGKAVRRTDFAGRKGDELPHQHEYDPATKGFKEKKPLDQQ